MRKSLNTRNAGAFTGSDLKQVETLLAAAWEELEGSDDGGMQAYKLLARTQNFEWKPPCLTFSLVRHGAAVLGSKRGEVQHWEVDVESGKVRMCVSGHKQLEPNSLRLDVKTMAAEIADIILRARQDVRVNRKTPSLAKILISDLIPAEGPAATTAGRRKRFWNALEAELKPQGWRIDRARQSAVQEQ